MDSEQKDLKELQKDILNQDEVQENIKYYAFGAEQGKKGTYFYTRMRHGSKQVLMEDISSNIFFREKIFTQSLL